MNKESDRKHLKIGIKYCGGCNPEFDRIAAVKDIKKELYGKAVFVSPNEGAELILVVNGCRHA